MAKAGWITLAAGLALAGCGEAAPDVNSSALADRIAIEDMVTEYYGHLGSGESAGIEEYFTKDAVLDVNGIIASGHAEIAALYAGTSDDGDANPAELGTFQMLLSNPRITVDGDTATAQFIWTGIINEAIQSPPRLLEQGREYDQLAKVDGKWMFTKRVIIADSGLPDSYMPTYTPRKNFTVGDLAKSEATPTEAAATKSAND